MYRVHLSIVGFELTFVVIVTDYMCSCKSNYIQDENKFNNI